MIQKCIALFLVTTMFGMTLPAFAGEPVDPKLLPPDPARFSLAPRGIVFAPPQSGQQPASQPPQSQPKHLTTTGRVLKWVGVGLMGEGALTMGLGVAAASTDCYFWDTSCTSTVKGVYYGMGGASIGVGAVLLLVGLHKKE